MRDIARPEMNEDLNTASRTAELIVALGGTAPAPAGTTVYLAYAHHKHTSQPYNPLGIFNTLPAAVAALGEHALNFWNFNRPVFRAMALLDGPPWMSEDLYERAFSACPHNVDPHEHAYARETALAELDRLRTAWIAHNSIYSAAAEYIGNGLWLSDRNGRPADPYDWHTLITEHRINEATGRYLHAH